MRLAGYYIEIRLSVFDYLSMALLTILWFAAIFALRMGLAFLEILPQLGSLSPDFQLSPRLELLTSSPILTSFILALILGPITHSGVTNAAAFKVYRSLEQQEAEEPNAELEGQGMGGQEPPDEGAC